MNCNALRMSERYTCNIGFVFLFFFFFDGFDASKVVLEVKIEVGLSYEKRIYL